MARRRAPGNAPGYRAGQAGFETLRSGAGNGTVQRGAGKRPLAVSTTISSSFAHRRGAICQGESDVTVPKRRRAPVRGYAPWCMALAEDVIRRAQARLGTVVGNKWRLE